MERPTRPAAAPAEATGRGDVAGGRRSARGGHKIGGAGVGGAEVGGTGIGRGHGGVGPGILSGPLDGPWRRPRTYREVEATTGLVVTHLGSRFKGAVVRFEHDGSVVLRSANTGLERLFTLRPASFGLAGETVTLVRPAPVAPAPVAPGGGRAGGRTASGSLAVAAGRARVARASRLLVEGVHDAELVEKVWGDDLRVEGVVVERLDGIDVLEEKIHSLGVPGTGPGEGAGESAVRLGVLVDHLVPGTKESRIASRLQGRWVRIAGTPYVDVWQAIKPSVAGLDAWPEVPRGRPWKEGICEVFAEPSPARLWKQLLGRVGTYADLEPSLVGAVESLIDFVTVGY